MTIGKKVDFANMTRDEKIKELTEAYEESIEEIGQVLTGLDLMVQGLRAMKMSDAQIWATVAVSAADALQLDLDTAGGMGAAGVLATYQVRG
jgi:hypothetical protein